MSVECDFCKESIEVDTYPEDFDENGVLLDGVKFDLLFEHEVDCPNQDMFPLKFLVEGEDDLRKVAWRIKAFGQELEDKADDGWQLCNEVDNGHINMAKYA